MGIEPTSQPWQGRIITFILYLHIIFDNNQVDTFSHFWNSGRLGTYASSFDCYVNQGTKLLCRFERQTPSFYVGMLPLHQTGNVFCCERPRSRALKERKFMYQGTNCFNQKMAIKYSLCVCCICPIV